MLRKNKSCIRGFYLATAGQNFKYSKLSPVGFGSWEALTFNGAKLSTKAYLSYYQKLISKFKFMRINRLLNNGE
jgi:hypothetical protein